MRQIFLLILSICLAQVAPAAVADQLVVDKLMAALPSPPDASVKSSKALADSIIRNRKAPSDAVAWTATGDALAQEMRRTGNEKYYDCAEIAYHEAIKINPNQADALAGMAWVSGGRHQFDISISFAKEALAAEEGNIAARGIYGDAAVELGDYDLAFDQYQKMMDLRPDLSSWSRGAHLLWLTGNHTKAINLMQKSIRAGAPFAENTDWCRANLAMMLFQEGAFIPAAQTIEPSLAGGSHNIHVLLAAGRITAATGDFAKAATHFKQVLEGGPNHDALAALGDLEMVQGHKEEAEKYYQQVETLHRATLVNSSHSHLNVAKFFADHDRNLKEALKIAEQRKETRNVIEADILAWVYFKNGDLPRAKEYMRRALKQNTPDAEMHFHAGLIADANGDRPTAAKHLSTALSFNPKFSLLLAPVAVQKLAELGGHHAATKQAEPEAPKP